jgi:hypothetical protein
MPIINSIAPKGGQQIVYENVSDILRESPSFLEGLPIDKLTISDPHRGYVVGLDDLVSGKLLSAAKLKIWRYLLLNGTKAVGAVELNASDEIGNSLEFLSLQHTRFANSTIAALKKAEKLPQIKKQDYEPRYLIIPGVYFLAIWLHATSDDILIPLRPSPGEVKGNQSYTESQIIKLLNPIAVDARKSDAAFKIHKIKYSNLLKRQP